MAFLIPENIPSRSGVPDRLRQVARALRDYMPHETTVWMRQMEDGSRYLEVLDPGSGVAVIEAPSVKMSGRRRRRPWRSFKQEDLVRIRDDIAERTEDLRQGLERARLKSLPVRPVLAVSDYDEVPLAVLDRLQGEIPVLTRSDMREDRLRSVIRRILGRHDRAPLRRRQENLARAVINPEIVISRAGPGETLPLFQEPEIAPEDVIRVMDREQERVAEHLGWGYRMLRGVAGSGKTLVLTHRARHLHRLFPNYRILLVCYNRLLANALRLMVDESDHVTVTNIDRLAWSLAQPRTTGRSTPDFEEIRGRAAIAADRRPDSQRYDVVLVDEAQDFDPPGLDLAYRMLKSARRDLGATVQNLQSYRSGHFVMAMDSAQNVYRRAMTWNPPGLSARGRTKVFRTNYRNTKEILGFAWSFLGGADGRPPAPADADDVAALISPEATRRTGPGPRLLDCAGLRGEAEALAAEVREMIESGTPVGDIAVMYGHRDLEEYLRTAFRRRRLPYFNVQNPKSNRDKAMEVDDHVRVSTLQGLKGLEFSRVLIGGVNQAYVYDVAEEEREAAVKRLLYVAMTRAMDELVITTSGDGEMGRALRKARSA